MRIASDSAAYYLQKAQLSRMLGESSSVALYADSALAVALRQRNNRPDDPRFLSELGLAYAALGDREKALEYTGTAVELLPTSRDAFDALFLILNYAEVLLLFGEYDMAIGQLEDLLMIPGFVSEPYLRLDPLWRPLQGNEKFEALLEKVKAG
jgi:tetratricopeptide (TPR) repeat protein